MKRVTGMMVALAVMQATGAMAAKRLVNTDRDGVALQGYDPVAYFTDGKPVKGKAEFQRQHNGGLYYFASADHKKLFDENPDTYVPAYGGYCGYAASINRISPIDPHFWQVIDGRLILQHNQKALDLWNQDVPGNVVKADANWPALVDKNGAEGLILVSTDKHGVALEGYDVISYFTQDKPVKGDPSQEAMFKGARYLFSSKENRATFEQDPTKYEPAYGGYCGYAAAINRISPVNPLIYQIHDGRLILQHTQEAYDLFNRDLPGNVVKADGNWPGLVERNGSSGGKRAGGFLSRLFGR